jgi:ABC-type transporter Mla maintaining outer membrane lipid asymmetry ATPase subunit MlaF
VDIRAHAGLQPEATDRRRANHGPRCDHSGADPRSDERVKQRVGAAIILITHDLGVVAEIAERVLVMYAGRKVEEAPVQKLQPHFDELEQCVALVRGDAERRDARYT